MHFTSLISRKNFFSLAAAGLLYVSGSPSLVVASGYEFDGVGARAVARGGAVIADSGDWTAIYWNPAGLAAAGKREGGIELRAGRMYSKDGNSFNVLGSNPFDKDKLSSGFVIGSMGAAVPLDADSAIGAGVYSPLMQGSDFEDTSASNPLYLKYKSYVVTGVANVSYARKLTDRLSAGLGVNAMYGALKSKSDVTWSGPQYQHNESDAEGYGIEGMAGLTYAINDRWTAGAVLRTGARIELEGEETVVVNNGAYTAKSDFETTVHHPATTGVGLAWQARKDLKLTCDVTQTWWKGFSNSLTYDTPDGTFLVSHGNTYHWFNSVKLRLGALKRLSEKTEVMAGYAFDTWAIDKKSVDFSTAVDVPMHRFSAAVSHTWSPVETTLGALAGAGRRTSGGVDYSVKGWYVIGEARYRF